MYSHYLVLIHKTWCKERRRHIAKLSVVNEALRPSDISQGLPSLNERILLFDNFRKIHIWSLNDVVNSIVFLHGGVDAFDVSRLYTSLQSPYRADCGRNPSIAFTLDFAEVLPLTPNQDAVVEPVHDE